MIRTLFTAAALACAIVIGGAAKPTDAAPLLATPIPGGAFFVEDMTDVAFTSAGLTVQSGIDAPLGQGFAFGGPLADLLSPLSFSASIAPLDDGFTGDFVVFDFIGGGALLFGQLLSFGGEDGVLSGAARVLGGDAASAFGGFVLLSLASPEFDAFTLDADYGSGVTTVGNVTVTLDAATIPLPLPPTLPLLANALAGLVMFRRRPFWSKVASTAATSASLHCRPRSSST